MLWIAFKILYLCRSKGTFNLFGVANLCCESLSKFCIFAGRKERALRFPPFGTVVNRFQNFVSLPVERNLSLIQIEAHSVVNRFQNFVSLPVERNWRRRNSRRRSVVNRFQNFVSLPVERNLPLYLRYHIRVVNRFQNFVSLPVERNKQLHNIGSPVVVNRFQNFVSLPVERNQLDKTLGAYLLWIAFKILYLCRSKGTTRLFSLLTVSCESLSKFCIFAGRKERTEFN